MRNQKLRFTFGHILAYISLIFIGYISFLGLTYWGDGNFILSGILTGVIGLDDLFARIKSCCPLF